MGWEWELKKRGGAESEAGPIVARPHQSINSNYYSKFITVTQINAAALLS